MALHIVLVEPEIPPNTGNIARTAAATDSVLHLVKPLGFSIDDKSLKRAGLDYWPYVKLEVHESLDDFMAEYGDRRMWLATTKGGRNYTDVEYRDEDMILFGRETAGLPRDFIAEHEEQSVRIPMSAETRLRSFNLSNSANIVLFRLLLFKRPEGWPRLFRKQHLSVTGQSPVPRSSLLFVSRKRKQKRFAAALPGLRQPCFFAAAARMTSMATLPSISSTGALLEKSQTGFWKP